MSQTRVETGYAPVNGLRMYYEIHGQGQGVVGQGVPLVLVHGALSGIGTSFGQVLPGLAGARRVIALELQGHGRTADIDRPLTIEQLAEDVAALLGHLGIAEADLCGYSNGAAAVLQTALQRPELVRKLVAISLTYNRAGVHPGLYEGIDEMKPEDLDGSPFQQEYAAIAPKPENWPALIEKNKRLDHDFAGWPAEAVRSLRPPTLLVIGDSDIVRPEHAVEIFRLLGGGVFGDLAGLPRSRLAILPGSTHTTVVNRGEWLASMINDFLDAPVPASG